jgi:hypothetical protein
MAPAECAVRTPTLAIGSERRDEKDIAEPSRQGGIQTVTIRRAVALANKVARIAGQYYGKIARSIELMA